MSKPKAVPLIPEKDYGIVEAMVTGGDVIQAVKDAGLNLPEKSAKVYAQHVWAKHANGNQSMIEALAAKGVDPSRLASKMSDLLDAQTVMNSKGMLIDVPDNATQLRALDMAMKTVGGYAATKSEHVEVKLEHILLEIDD